MPFTKEELIEIVRQTFGEGPPSGWLLGWDSDRHFSGFASVVAPELARNVTEFDYAFCNHFEVRLDGIVGGHFATLTVLLSYVANVYALHWTLYESGGRSGHVVGSAPSEMAGSLQIRVEAWLSHIGFVPLPDDWGEMEIDGIELELSGAIHVTLNKCMFRDYEG